MYGVGRRGGEVLCARARSGGENEGYIPTQIITKLDQRKKRGRKAQKAKKELGKRKKKCLNKIPLK